MNSDEMAHGEIIIIKRGGEHEDEHHGGVWKIAFADFMTALMAFFLVMWLINASNEKTKKAVASYFNPIKLMDTTSNPKGVKNPKYGIKQESETEEESTEVKIPAKVLVTSKTANMKFSDQAIFVDPYAILSEIAGGITEVESGDLKTSDNRPEQDTTIGISNGTSFQDPFDPTSWSMQAGLPKDPYTPTTPVDRMSQNANEKPENITGMMKSEAENLPNLPELNVETKPEETKPEEKPDAETEVEVEAEKIEQELTEKEIVELEQKEGSEKLAKILNEKVGELFNNQNLSDLDIEIIANAEGAAVVLFDKSQSGMFSIGSARPTQELVLAMEKIGDVVSEHKGTIEISGHTDGRKYQSADYDNWRLSSARAQMAYYMLVRGGMNESQVEKIAGQAAVKLKIPEEPFAAANRRIEVLLKLPL